jgi:hypothetical protein
MQVRTYVVCVHHRRKMNFRRQYKNLCISEAVLRIRIRIRIHMFLGIPDPDLGPLVRGVDPDPSTTMQKCEEKL